jgi:uncharacterized protein
LPLLVCAVSAAADFSILQPQGHVSDFANVLNSAHRAELERYCARVEAITGAELALVTVPTLGGEPIEDVANTLFRRWGVGKKGKDQGVMLMLVPRDRRMRLEVGYGLEPIMPDGYAGTLLRQLRPLLRSQDYGAALLEATHQIGTTIAAAKNVTIDATIPSCREVRHDPIREMSPLLIPVGLFLLFAFAFRRRRGYSRSGLPWVIPMGGDWSSHGGGGFGGYDSSDSFGGFGGGDSGGGGASSDW